MEDLYGDGQPAGQVGQEIYGCGAAFAFTTRSFHQVKGGPFVLFCDHPLHEWDETEDACLSFRARGVADVPCRVRLIPTGRKPLPTVHVCDEPGNTFAVRTTDEGHAEFDVPADCYVEVRWGGHGKRGAANA